MVGEHSLIVEVVSVRNGGGKRRENVGISSKKSDENSDHRKPKVSRATQIDPGLVEPNRPRLIAFGYLAIILDFLFRFIIRV